MMKDDDDAEDGEDMTVKKDFGEDGDGEQDGDDDGEDMTVKKILVKMMMMVNKKMVMIMVNKKMVMMMIRSFWY
jgi:hypothetical protein